MLSLVGFMGNTATTLTLRSNSLEMKHLFVRSVGNPKQVESMKELIKTRVLTHLL